MLASKMQIAAKRWLALVMLLPASLYLVAEGEGETGKRRGRERERPLFANYLYSCFVPFRHSQRLVRYYYKVQAEVTSAGRHIIYVISVLNYLHRKYGRLTSASTATVGDVLSPPFGQFWRWAQRFPNCLSFFFFRFVSSFSAYSSFSDLFVIVAALGSRSPISAFSLPPRMRPMICLSGPSVLYCAFCSASFSLLLHSVFFLSFLHYFCLSCCLFCFTFRCGCHCNFLISRFPSFRHLFRLFSGAFAGNWIIRLHASLALIPVRHVPGMGVGTQLKYLHNFWVLAFACRFSKKSSLHFFHSSTS